MHEKTNINQNNKRILKNTILLYTRMFATMGLSFFATRELLIALGVIDFGLVNVIGSAALMFSFLSGTMQATTTKYLSSEISTRDSIKIRKIFNLTLLIYVTLLFIIIKLSYTIGLWFFENKLSIPNDRKSAGIEFYYLSIIAFGLNILSIPYSSLIISHEQIKIYAWIGTIESISRLAIVYGLYIGFNDRLTTYGELLILVSILNLLIYATYCQRKYPECKPLLYWNKNQFKEMVLFAFWNLWGALSGLFCNVFINILLNNHFGPTVNAARGIAMQGASGVSTFVNNFLTAAKPQIYKYYAEGRKDVAVDLSINAARTGFFLMLLFCIPILLEMKFILNLWLSNAPKEADIYMRLILIQRLIETITYTLATLSQASGHIALYQTIISIIQWCIFPASWIGLEIGWDSTSVFYIGIILSIISLPIQLKIINTIVKEFNAAHFLIKVIYPCTIVSAISFLVPTLFHITMDEGWIRLATVSATSFISTSIIIYYIGLNKIERNNITKYLKTKRGKL